MAKIERTKNATRNIVFGIILKVYQILVPFFMRTAMIYFMGIQYLGLNSLFTSILQVLNLAELGVGSAMIYSMYKPIAADDEKTICALMRLYRTFYRVIGLIIAVIGCALTPFIPYLIKKDVPYGINIYILYLLNLSATVLSYWLFSYKNSILQAHQRNDVVSKVTLFTNTLQYIFQLLVLWIFKNYYYYVIVLLLTQATTNIVTAYFANKLYPNYQPKGQVDKEVVKQITQRIKDLFTSKIGSVVYDSADTIVISSFLGLTMLAIYQNYYFILNSITACIAVIFAACTAGIGNSIVVETKEKNYKDFKKFTFIITWLAGFCATCLLNLYQPFVILWVGKENTVAFFAVVCFVIYFFIRQLNALFNLYKDASGIWHEDRFRPLVSAGVNLGLNIILVNYIGIYGIILSTVIAIVIVGIPWLLHNLFTVIFDKNNLKSYLKKLFMYCLVVLLGCVISYFACSLINISSLLITLIIRLIVCIVITNLLYFIAFKRTEEFNQTIELVDKMTNGKLNFLRKI